MDFIDKLPLPGGCLRPLGWLLLVGGGFPLLLLLLFAERGLLRWVLLYPAAAVFMGGVILLVITAEPSGEGSREVSDAGDDVDLDFD